MTRLLTLRFLKCYALAALFAALFILAGCTTFTPQSLSDGIAIAAAHGTTAAQRVAVHCAVGDIRPARCAQLKADLQHIHDTIQLAEDALNEGREEESEGRLEQARATLIVIRTIVEAADE